MLTGSDQRKNWRMNDKYRFKYAVRFVLISITLLWSVKALELTSQFDFSEFGIFPRTLKGSMGIFFAPFIHGNVFHLISNTFPLIFLGIGLFYFYHKIAWQVILAIYLMSGFWVWLAAREAYHIGASGVIYGLIFFMLLSGFIRKNTRSLAISFVVILLYGGNMFLGIIPVDNGVSWESHLMGAIAGTFLAIYFRGTELEHEKAAENSVENSTAMPSEFHYYYKESDTSTEVRKYNYRLNEENKSETD